MLHAFRGDFLQPFLDLTAEGRADFHIKPAADERKANGSAAISVSFTQMPLIMHWPGSKDDSARLKLLFKLTPLRPEATRVCAIRLCVMLEHAIARRTTIAIQTARRLRLRVSGVTVAGGHAPATVG